jgi:hypothetical protein
LAASAITAKQSAATIRVTIGLRGARIGESWHSTATSPCAVQGARFVSRQNASAVIAFATLLLGLVAGEVRIDLLVTPPARSVELFVDGRSCGRRVAPPWSIACELGAELRPRRLVAVAYDAGGVELARTEQRLNIDRPEAELALLVERRDDGEVDLLVAAASAAAQPPRAVTVEVDGAKVAVADPARVRLPPLDLAVPHLVRVEAAWSERVRTAVDAVLGGEFGSELTTQLTAVPIRVEGRGTPAPAALAAAFERDGRTLRVAAVERGAGELWVVAHPEQFDRLARLMSRRGLSDAVGGIDWRSVGSLAPDDRIRLVWPWPERRQHAGRVHELFLPSPAISARDGGLPWVLSRARLPALGDGPPRLASAAAVAAMSLAGLERRRAVLVLLDATAPPDDPLEPARLRRYLESLRVPLHVWRLRRWRSAESDPWAPAALVDTANRFTVAVQALADDLETQRIVWLEGAHLPAELEIAARFDVAFAAGPAAEAPGESDPSSTATAADDDAAIDESAAALAEARRAAFDAALGAGARRAVVEGLEVAVAAQLPLSPEVLAKALGEGLAHWDESVGIARPPLDGARLGIVARLADHPELARQASAIGIRGQTAGGVAVLAVEGRPSADVEALALHELAHLLAERALPQALPVWLEEGLAERLARFVRQGGEFRRRGTLERLVEARGVRTQATGPIADLLALARDAERGALPPLGEWTALSWREFVAPERRARHYALAGELAAFLLFGEDDRAPRLRAVLARAATDGEIDLEGELASALGNAGELDAAFRAWLAAERDRTVAAADSLAGSG